MRTSQDLLEPAKSLRQRLAQRIGKPLPADVPSWSEAPWEEVAPGISCKLLASDEASGMVSMLVRASLRGAEYPPYVHGGVEELHVLEGELSIGKGCICVLVTNGKDVLQ